MKVYNVFAGKITVATLVKENRVTYEVQGRVFHKNRSLSGRRPEELGAFYTEKTFKREDEARDFCREQLGVWSVWVLEQVNRVEALQADLINHVYQNLE